MFRVSDTTHKLQAANMTHHGALVSNCSLAVAADAHVFDAKGRMAEYYDQRAPPVSCYGQLNRALIEEQCMLWLV